MNTIFKRRAFLKRAGKIFIAGIVGALAVIFGGFLNRFIKEKNTVGLSLKKLSSDFYAQDAFFVFKEQGSFRVLSRQCPHLRCTLQLAEGEDKIVCPCHGSTFTLQGKYINGPAKKDMQALPFEKITADSIKINMS